MLNIISTYIGKDNRVRAYCRDENNNVYIKSYPRILMEKKLGRPLEPYEDVHHIDGDKTNNDLLNLKVIIHGEHQKEHSTKYADKIALCDVCHKKFIWTAVRQRAYYSDLRRNKKRIISCSKSCSSFYGRQEQLGRNTLAEYGLNGEPSPNGNTVPNSSYDT